MFVPRKLFDFDVIKKDPGQFAAMLADHTLFRPVKTEAIMQADKSIKTLIGPLNFTPSYLNLLLTDRNGPGPRLTYAEVKR